MCSFQSKTSIFFFFLLLISNAFAATHKIGPNQRIKTIQKGIETAHSHDTLLIQKNVYKENLISVDKPLFIMGVNDPVIDGQNGEEIMVINSDSVTVKGLFFKNVGVSFLKDRAAIRLNNVNYVTITENKLYNTFFGIYLQKATRCIISNNIIIGKVEKEYNAGNAIHVWKAEKIVIANNFVNQHRDGIYFEFVDKSLITGNISINNIRYGLHFMFSNNDVYEHNSFINNGSGVAVMFSNHIEMYYNKFADNWGKSSYGLLLKEISHGSMKYNVFSKNTYGINAEGASYLILQYNDFISNGKAINMKGNCMDLQVIENNFIHNTYEVITNSQANLNFYEGNYWSQYKGYDLNKDGIGDVPYRPVNLFSKITNKVPAANMLLHSFLVQSIDAAERVFPQFIPETLIDKKPRMKKIIYD